MQKFTTFDEAERYMEKDKELKRLKERIQELQKRIKEFQQDVIIELLLKRKQERNFQKSFLPEYALAKEIKSAKSTPKKSKITLRGIRGVSAAEAHLNKRIHRSHHTDNIVQTKCLDLWVNSAENNFD